VTVKTAPGQGAVFTIRVRGTGLFSTETASPVPEVPGSHAPRTSGA
jgi:hypothetical protein